MPYKDPDKAKEAHKILKRKRRGYKRSQRTAKFHENFPNADLSILSRDEREAVERYHLQLESLQAIAQDWGCSREWVRQIIKSAENKLSENT
ncbi:hypothetical protein NIES4101_53800 [Calothrix sp. NIES-4101]|nr:hypothetical protein NIES4101_53800 [Calothrix sp. NIES-4101]